MKKETWLKKPVKRLLAKLEEEFNKYIRYRDSDGEGYAECISCGKQIKLGTIDYQAGHYVPVSMSSYWRFQEENVNAQCSYCNSFDKERAKLNYRKGMRDKYGHDHEEYIWDNRHKQVIKWNKTWLVERIFHYRELTEETKKIKGLE